MRPADQLGSRHQSVLPNLLLIDPLEGNHATHPPSRSTNRRGFLAASLAATAAAFPGSSRAAANADPPRGVTESQIRDYLKTLLLTRQDLDAWLAGDAFPFNKYDPELGYLHINRDLKEGQDGAICRYRYDKLDARQTIAFAEQPCRMNTYGNSFTSCEQVSDGETWQEVLATHLGEPIRNYGIGGYSVYQAYLRMLREEQKAPAQYIVFNIFDDDHVRNLHGWQRFKFGVNKISPNPTVPHLKVDLRAGTIAEQPNPCPTRDSLYDLCDLDRVYDMFHDDFYLRNRLARAAQRARKETVPPADYDDGQLIEPGIFASTQVIPRVVDFARKNGKSLLFVLSYGSYTIKQFLDQGQRFDQALVDFLNKAQLPYVDLMQAHAAEAQQFKGTSDEYLARYFISHYNPLGNHFCAFAMKDALVGMLDPKPPAYPR